MSSSWSVYHLQSHGTCSTLRALKAEVVVIDVVAAVFLDPGWGPQAKRWRKNIS